MPPSRLRIFALGASLALAVGACSSSKKAADTTAAAAADTTAGADTTAPSADTTAAAAAATDTTAATADTTAGADTTAAASAAATAAAGDTLVIDKSFDLKTVDPGRTFEITGNMLVRAMYENLVTFENNDVSTPKAELADSFTANADATEFTFKLRDGVKFGDGSALDSADVVFSLQRVQNLKGNGSFLVDGLTFAAPDPLTVVIKSAKPNAALTRILASPTLAVVNADVVKAAGGSDAVGADQSDKAEGALNKASAGTGPYVLDSFSLSDQTVITANPNYKGKNTAKYKKIVFRNADAATQALNLQSGQSDIALDLGGDQLSQLKSATGVNIDKVSSPNVWFLFTNADPKISAIASKPEYRDAVRYGLDYTALLDLVGEGGSQAAGLIPSQFLGALKADAAIKRDVARAKAAYAKCACPGSVKLEYPSDFAANGLNFGPVAERIKANLEEVGLKVELVPSPIQAALANYRAGKEEMGLWLWGPDYPDPNDYLVFGPGGLVGKRAGWNTGADPAIEAVVTEVTPVSDDAKRIELFTKFQTMMNEKGPFMQIFQPTAVVASGAKVEPVKFHPTLQIDPLLVTPKV